LGIVEEYAFKIAEIKKYYLPQQQKLEVPVQRK
jgi:hypothetical protein